MMQELSIDPDTIFLLLIAIIIILICMWCCGNGSSKNDIRVVTGNQNIMLRSINDQLRIIGGAVDNIRMDINHLQGQVNRIEEELNDQGQR